MYGRALTSIALAGVLTFAAQAQPVKARAAESVRIGIYVMRLSDLNPATQSFSADFWVWTLSSASTPSHPIQTLRVQNAKAIAASDWKEDIVGGYRWGYREFNATIIYDWDMLGFPYDRHQLEIDVGETEGDVRRIVYTADSSDSGIASNIRLTDWRLGPAKLVTGIYPYASRFGDPTLPRPLTQWAEAHLLFEIRRMGRGPSFFKLTFTAYVAFAMMLLSFFMERPIFSSRISLLVGSLFATVVSTRTSAAALGNSPKFTLVEQVHLIVIGYILLSAIVAIRTYYAADEKPEMARRIDRIVAVLAAVSFIGWNLFLVADAVRH